MSEAGVFVRVLGRDPSRYLSPLVERAGLEVDPTSDVVEPIDVLTAELRLVAAARGDRAQPDRVAGAHP